MANLLTRDDRALRAMSAGWCERAAGRPVTPVEASGAVVL